ncbi:hypothetical protein CUMW_172070, partial [Citrus unshiu]
MEEIEEGISNNWYYKGTTNEIYYAPLHPAFRIPYKITTLYLSYFCIISSGIIPNIYFNYITSTTRTSMHNLSIQYLFPSNLIFQSFNHFLLPSSMSARLDVIYNKQFWWLVNLSHFIHEMGWIGISFDETKEVY